MLLVVPGIAALAGCGSRAGSTETHNAAMARLDLVESEGVEQAKALVEMSKRITELENLVLKQTNDLKKIKAEIGTKPKTLEPMPVAAETTQGDQDWDSAPIVATSEYGQQWAPEDESDEEPRPLLQIYGTPEPDPQDQGAGTSGTGSPLTPAALFTDGSGLGGLVSMTLPPLATSLPKVDDAVGSTGPGAITPEVKAVDPYEQGIMKYETKEWSSAILYFDIYLKHQPKGNKALDALFLKAESLYQMGKYLDAIGQFELVLERYPKSGRAASAMLRIGRCYEKLGDKSKAKSIYQDLILGFPGTSQADKAGKLVSALE